MLSFHHHHKHKMNHKYGFLVVCLILIQQLAICSGQLATSFIKELKGLKNTYRNQGFIPAPNCTHETRNLSFLTFKDAIKFTSCLREIDEQGRIKQHPDQDKRADEIIRDHGYHLVTYNNLTSSDGYIQTLFRITGSPKSPPRMGKTAVLLFHGAMGASDEFFALRDKSLPFKLANAGYEVWLPNSRGTDYSMRHTKYDPNWNLEYWNFSLHEIAIYDVPMIIDLMLAETGTKKVFYVGHSMGATIYSIAVAEQPELNEKIHASFSFGGGGSFAHATTPVKGLFKLLDFEPRIQNLIIVALRGRVTLGNALIRYFGSRFCSATPLTCKFCGMSASTSSMHGEPDLKYTDIPYIISVLPNSVGLKVVLHAAQNYRNCKLHKYDYGPIQNVEIYGQSEPPLYNLKNIRAPMHIYYGESDDFTPVQDVTEYRDSLPHETVRVFYKIPWKPFDHFDFIMGRNVDSLVYDKVLNDMKHYIHK